MDRVPVFLEVPEKSGNAALQICRKTMAILFKQKIAPLPFASSIKELRELLKTLSARGLSPSLYIVNTLNAEELLAELDPLLGQTPVLFFTRQIFSSETLVMLKATVTRDRVSELLEKMSPRKMNLWPYGSRNVEDTAQKASQGILRFLNDGDFVHLARSQFSPEELSAALRCGDAEGVKRLLTGSRPSSGRLKPVSGNSGIHSVSSAGMRAPAVPPTASSASLSGLHGALSQMSVATVLSMLDMEKKSGVLGVMREELTAQFFVSRGRILRAQLLGSPVPDDCRGGVECILHVMKWQNGLFNFVAGEIGGPDEVNAGTTQLLMEAARRSDEPAEKVG